MLFHLLASLSTSVLAIPSGLNSPHAAPGNQDSRGIRSIASSILPSDSLIDTKNLTIPITGFSESNTSSNAEPRLFCYINPPLPAPPAWGDISIYECGLLITTFLADGSVDLPAYHWNSVYPLVLPWTWGISPRCTIRITAIHPGSLDVFQRVMVAQRAALIVSRCLNNNGGAISVGPKEQFQVQMFASVTRATA